MGAEEEEEGLGRTRRRSEGPSVKALPSRPSEKRRGTPVILRARPVNAPATPWWRFHPSFSSSHLRPLSSPPPHPALLFSLSLLLICLTGAVGAKSHEYSNGDGSGQRNWRITCYTCVNVSNNDECNRFAIDRPCPEGGDYCLTLHIMEGKDKERSLLVNKRCASLEDCIGDSTGCNTAYGQTQCVSCCDQPYCNDSVPSNDTNAVFYRSSARSATVGNGILGVIWRSGVALIPALKVLSCAGLS